MILSYEGHQPFKIEPGKVTVIATNNRNVYFDLIQGIKGLGKLNLVDDNYKEIEITHIIDWDGDVVANCDLNEKYRHLIIKSVINNMNDSQRHEIGADVEKLFTDLQEMLFMVDLPLEVQFNGDFKNLLTYSKPTLSSLIMSKPYDKIKTDLKIHLECSSNSCVGLSNVANYLSATQFKELLDDVQQLNIPVLLIEFTEIKNRDYYGKSLFYFVDEDFVDWKF